ncbi:piggyBac transposable element-derived protein 3-like [Branchiostoma floridae]|uniref:PiggyBac transposable element-derived protein 3-like n=1 Tax=Branchiostoma floridae TaxID=7739 RepID=A0A9J7KKS7_BRAFL|nr:piggyBac transposable element-derived protein 3-like [Branchiostoma floridae]
MASGDDEEIEEDIEMYLREAAVAERAEAAGANGTVGQNIAGEVDSDDSDDFDLYSVTKQVRGARVGEFSRRNKARGRAERPWASVSAGEVHPYKPQKFRAPGPVGPRRAEDNRNELSFFLEVLDQYLIRYIVRCTNRYARQRRRVFRKERRSRWSPTSTTELKAFLGCMICAGYTYQPRLDLYWSDDDDVGCTLMKRTFPSHRFRQILRYLHYSPEGFCPPGSERLKSFKAREKLDRVMKVRKVMERVSRNSCRARHVGEHLVVDEATVAFRGRHSLRRYNPSKPTKYGYCLRALAETDGYILSDEVCGGRADPEDMSPDERCMHGIGDEYVSPLDLKPARVVNRLTMPFQGCYRTVYCDSYYTGVQLADYLFTKDTYIVGTVRRNASGLPTEGHPVPRKPGPGPGRPPLLKFPDPYPKSVPRGTSVRYHDGPVTVVKWQDTKSLILLSTGTSVCAPDELTTRRCKGPSGATRLEVTCPAAMNMYNLHYKAVDTADQLRAGYEFGRPSKKWHRQIFWYAMNKAVVNAFLNWKIYTAGRQDLPAHRVAQLSFRRALVRQLIGNFSARHRTPTASVALPGVIGNHRQISQGKPTKACRYCAKAGRHMPRAKRCRPFETVYKCEMCNVSVCHVSLRPECWREHLQDMQGDA